MKQYWETATAQMPALHYPPYRVQGRRRVKANWRYMWEGLLVFLMLLGSMTLAGLMMVLMFFVAFTIPTLGG